MRAFVTIACAHFLFVVRVLERPLYGPTNHCVCGSFPAWSHIFSGRTPGRRPPGGGAVLRLSPTRALQAPTLSLIIYNLQLPGSGPPPVRFPDRRSPVWVGYGG